MCCCLHPPLTRCGFSFFFDALHTFPFLLQRNYFCLDIYIISINMAETRHVVVAVRRGSVLTMVALMFWEREGTIERKK